MLRLLNSACAQRPVVRARTRSFCFSEGRTSREYQEKIKRLAGRWAENISLDRMQQINNTG